MNYEQWRITYQSSEHAARAAFDDVERMAARVSADLRHHAALRQFTLFIMQQCQHSTGIPTHQVQQQLINLGLLEHTAANKPCSTEPGKCLCDTIGSNFPSTCIRPAQWLEVHQ